MRLSAHRIRSINRSIARVNGIILWRVGQNPPGRARKPETSHFREPGISREDCGGAQSRNPVTADPAGEKSAKGWQVSPAPAKFDRVFEPGYNRTTEEGDTGDV